MANLIENVTLDGVTPATLTGTTFNWFGGIMPRMFGFNSNQGDTLTVNFFVTGAGWRIEHLRLSQFNVSANFVDVAGANGRIEYLRLGDGGSTVSLINTRIDYIRGFDTENNTITLGSQTTTAIALFNGNDEVTGGSGYTELISTGSGNDTVTGGSGGIGLARLGDGNDRFVAGTGYVEALRAGNGDDTVILGNGARMGLVHLGSGSDSLRLGGNGFAQSVISDGSANITLNGDSLIESLRAYDSATITLNGTATIQQAFLTGPQVRLTLNDSSRIFTLKTDQGVNRITTGDAWFESYYNFNGTNFLTIGTGGVGQITLAGSAANRHTVSADGWVGSLQVYDDVRVSVVLNAGAGYISTSGGDDSITTQGPESAGLIRTGGGNDVVRLGAGGAQFVDLGAGDDTIFLTAMAPARAIVIQGGSGVDTVDFSGIGQAVFASLAQSGAFQNIGAPSGTVVGVPGVIGYVSLAAVENLTGTIGNDTLQGRETDNVLDGGSGGGRDLLQGNEGNDTLIGGGGADRLFGGDGNDHLTGGKGNDRLTGGAGEDLFIFGRNDGSDRVQDFEVGADRITIAGVTALNQITFSSVSGGVRLEGNGTTILVEGVSLGDMNNADNFLF